MVRRAVLLAISLAACRAPQLLRGQGSRARAFRIDDPSQLLTGPGGRARLGDIRIENGLAAFIVDTAPEGFAETGGNLEGAALLGHPDLLNQMFASFADTFPRQAHYRSVEIADDGRGGAAVVRASGYDSMEPRLLVTTEYRLEAGTPALRITTTVENRTGAKLSRFALGDALQWGRAEHFEPGLGREVAGRKTQAPWLAGLGEGTSYLYFTTHPLSTFHGTSWSDPDVAVTDIEPGERAVYQRWLAVGSGDVASALQATARVQGGELGLVVGSLTGPDGAVSGLVRIARAGRPFATALAERGRFRAPLPPGEYELAGEAPGRGAAAPVEVAVKPASAGPTMASVSVTAESRLAADVRGEDGAPLPCKLTFERLDGGALDLGPLFRADGGRNVWLVPPRAVERAFPPGRYRVYVSRGPLYDLESREVTLAAGAVARVSVTLKKTVPLEGWLSGDFHQHAAPHSFDAATSMEDRALADAAEGVELLVGTDHNFVSDYRPVVEKLGLRDFVHAVAGDEMTLEGTGHWGCFPMVPHAEQPLGGAPPLTAGVTPTQLYEGCRANRPDDVVQLNHPRSGAMNGYFDAQGFDSASGASRKPVDLAADAIEVFNGKHLDMADRTLLDWYALLRRGVVLTATGNSDSHGIVEAEVGYPRNLVRVGTSSPRAVTDAELVEAVKRKRAVVVTNGPVLSLVVDGAGLGERIAAARAKVRIELRQANWVHADTIYLVANGAVVKSWPVAAEARRAEVEYVLEVREPTFVVALARGHRDLAPVVTASKGAPVTPLAFTNPVWIDPPIVR